MTLNGTMAAHWNTRRGHRRARRTFASTLAIMVAGILMLFVTVLGRYAVREIAGLRSELLAAQAEQALLSARDWSRAHVEQLHDADTLELPLDDLLAIPAAGRLELRCTGGVDGVSLIECQLSIRQGRRAVTRHVFWPLRRPT